MANGIPSVLSSLTFESHDLQRSDLSLHLDVVSGLNDGLEVRGEDTTIPSLTGQVARNRKKHQRTIVLGGLLQGAGSVEASRLASYQNLMDEVESIFNLLVVGTLTGHALDGTWRTIEARPTLIAWDPSPVLGVGGLGVTLISVDPDWDITGGGS